MIMLSDVFIWIEETFISRESLVTFGFHSRMWKVFYDDVNRPGRYLLAKEQPRRPDGTDIEVISLHHIFMLFPFFNCCSIIILLEPIYKYFRDLCVSWGTTRV